MQNVRKSFYMYLVQGFKCFLRRNMTKLRETIVDNGQKKVFTLGIVFSDWGNATRQGCFGSNSDN